MIAIAAVGRDVGAVSQCRPGLVLSAAAAARAAGAVPRAVAARLGYERRQAILDTLHSERFVDQSPAECMLRCSRSRGTSGRCARCIACWPRPTKCGNGAPRRGIRRTELVATAPNQVWSWDITKRPIPSLYYSLYVILDLFSRYVVGGWSRSPNGPAWRNASSRPRAASRASGRSSSRSTPTGARPCAASSSPSCSDLTIGASHSRPRVSNDNPFSEAQFRTFKYRPEFPARFGSLEHARAISHDLFTWYNDAHHHSGLSYLTPAAVHYGRAPGSSPCVTAPASRPTPRIRSSSADRHARKPCRPRCGSIGRRNRPASRPQRRSRRTTRSLG